MEIAMIPFLTSLLTMPAAVVIVGLIAGSSAATAQGQDAPEAMSAGMNAAMLQHGARMCQMDEHIDGDLAFLKAELKISEAQAPQWNLFAHAFRAEREKRARLCREALQQAHEVRSASLPEAIKLAEDQLAARLDSLRAMRVAVQPLYDSLSKDQKKSADQIMRGGQIF
jgi:hypothetical protein